MIVSIQYLRAIAVLLVVLSHTVWKSMQVGDHSLAWWHDAGIFGVDIFFIISGYIMVYITKKMHQKPHAVRTFLKKRFIRIVPLYWFYTLIALAIFLLMPERVNRTGGSTEIFQSFFLLPLAPHQNYLVNVAWTLHFEFIFYILFAFGLLFSLFKGIAFVSFFILLSLILFIFTDLVSLHYVFESLISDLFMEFLLGMLLYFLLSKMKKVPWSLALLAIFTGTMLFYYLHSEGTLTGLYHLDKGVSAFFICFGIIALEPFWQKKECKLLSNIGNASYSIYLLHPFVLTALSLMNKKIHYLFSTTQLLILCIVISFISGYLSYIFIEKNLIRVWKN